MVIPGALIRHQQAIHVISVYALSERLAICKVSAESKTSGLDLKLRQNFNRKVIHDKLRLFANYCEDTHIIDAENNFFLLNGLTMEIKNAYYWQNFHLPLNRKFYFCVSVGKLGQALSNVDAVSNMADLMRRDKNRQTFRFVLYVFPCCLNKRL